MVACLQMQGCKDTHCSWYCPSGDSYNELADEVSSRKQDFLDGVLPQFLCFHGIPKCAMSESLGLYLFLMPSLGFFSFGLFVLSYSNVLVFAFLMING